MATYDPKKITCVFNTVLLTGYAEDTFCEVSRDEDAFSKVTGAGGDVVRVRNQNKGGKVKFTLLASSPSNDALNAIANADEQRGAGIGTVMVKDTAGKSLHTGNNAWIMKKPDKTYSKGLPALEWTIDVADLSHEIGGITDP